MIILPFFKTHLFITSSTRPQIDYNEKYESMERTKNMNAIIAIIGIGYVGLQSALQISKSGLKTIAFDINEQRINELQQGIDSNLDSNINLQPNLFFTSNPNDLSEANYYLISIPTPINERKVPDIYPLKSAVKLIANFIKKGDVIILESTVFPGATREILIPLIEAQTGFASGKDFFVGYSPERIVPGDDQLNSLNKTKVIAGQNKEALQMIKDLYQTIDSFELHCAPNLEVAEACKLLENIQRDVNIALMNEFAQIMDKMNVSIHSVIEAANTKWNFLPFTPGLVGGHCIPEDPYYLIYQANKSGGLHNLISCARQTNEQFYLFILDVTLRLLIEQSFTLKNSRVALLGMSFKPNVTDTRHSLSVALYHRLKYLGFNAIAVDPLSHRTIPDLDWMKLSELRDCHAIILCQGHNELKNSVLRIYVLK